MNALLYIIRCGLYLALFYAFFLLMMKNTDFFRFNRVALAVGTAACLLLPLLRPEFPSEGAQLAERINAAIYAELEPIALAQGQGSGISTAGLLLGAYALGLVACATAVAISYAKLASVLSKVKPVRRDGCLVHISDSQAVSFCWMRHIFISRSDLEDNPAVYTHELMHARSHHSIDVAAFSLILIFQWFNPLVWMMWGQLKNMQEYEADKALIDRGINVTQYQLLLVKKAVGEKLFLMASGFNHTKLKNRLAMLQKEKSNGWYKLCYLLCIPLLSGAMILCGQSSASAAEPNVKPVMAESAEIQKDSTIKKVNYTEIDVKPTFNGGNANEFMRWLLENIKFPEKSVKEGVTGTVYVQMTISSTGKVKDVTIVRGVNEEINAEVLRATSSSPDWTPGYHKGEAVDVTYLFPVKFIKK